MFNEQKSVKPVITKEDVSCNKIISFRICPAKCGLSVNIMLNLLYFLNIEALFYEELYIELKTNSLSLIDNYFAKLIAHNCESVSVRINQILV